MRPANATFLLLAIFAATFWMAGPPALAELPGGLIGACTSPRVPAVQRVENCTRLIDAVADNERMRIKAYGARGIAYMKARQFEDALSDLSEFLAKDQTNAAMFVNRGICYYRLRQYESAIGDFSKAIEVKPDYAKAHSLRGTAYGKLDREAEALPDFDAVVRLQPGILKNYYNRGVSLYKVGRHEDALRDYDKVIAESTSNTGVYVGAHINKSWILGSSKYPELRDADAAVAVARKAVDLAPGSYLSYDSMGVAYAEAGQFEDAISAAETAADLAQRAGDTKYYNEIQDRLALYRNSEPYRE